MQEEIINYLGLTKPEKVTLKFFLDSLIKTPKNFMSERHHHIEYHIRNQKRILDFLSNINVKIGLETLPNKLMEEEIVNFFLKSPNLQFFSLLNPDHDIYNSSFEGCEKEFLENITANEAPNMYFITGIDHLRPFKGIHTYFEGLKNVILQFNGDCPINVSDGIYKLGYQSEKRITNFLIKGDI